MDKPLLGQVGESRDDLSTVAQKSVRQTRVNTGSLSGEEKQKTRKRVFFEIDNPVWTYYVGDYRHGEWGI